MNPAPLFERHRALRWLAPAAVVGVTALVATGVFDASPSSADMPPTTPAALIAAVRHADVSGFSGTVVTQLALGLPDLPAIGESGDSTSFTSLLSGSHTMQVWYGGPDKQRLAVLGTTDETDLFRDGRQVWQWSSADQTASYATLPASVGTRRAAPMAIPSASSLTPEQLAGQLLTKLDPSTKVRVVSGRTIADRSAYDLVLTPRTSATKVGSVRIAIDGDTKLPLGVSVYARGATSPSVDVSFTSIRFADQPDRTFVFTPPPDATVHRLGSGSASGGGTAHPSPAATGTATGSTQLPSTTGSGWATVARFEPGKAAIAKLGKQGIDGALRAVSGSWGTGRLLDASLVSVLVTDDGRVYAGAVAPQALYTAAGSK